MKDFVDAVEGGLEQNGLNVVVETVTPRWMTTETSRGNLMNCCHVVIRGHVYHESGQSLPFQFPGESWDVGDKSLYKSVTGARKYALSCLFNLKGGTDPESDERTSRAVADGGAAPRGEARQQRPDNRRPPAGTPEARASAAAAVAATGAPPNADAPVKKTPLEKIADFPTAIEVANYLLELPARYPFATFADRWLGMLAIAEEKAATFDEAGRAAILAVVYGARATLAGLAADAAKAAGAPAAAPPAAPPAAATPVEAPLAHPCPPEQDVYDWVDAQMDPADLANLMEMLATSPRCANIRANAERFEQMVDYAKRRTEVSLHEEVWTVDACDRLLTRLAELTQMINSQK
jgi:hypothetical protein